MLKRYLVRSPSRPSRSAINICKAAAAVVEGRKGVQECGLGNKYTRVATERAEVARLRREQLHLVPVVIVQMFQQNALECLEGHVAVDLKQRVRGEDSGYR
jgi:hypothetical protein